MKQPKVLMTANDISTLPPREVAGAEKIVEKEVKKGAGEPLNFRVDPEFGLRFRVYAAQHRMRLQDLLVLAFETLEKQDRKDS